MGNESMRVHGSGLIRLPINELKEGSRQAVIQFIWSFLGVGSPGSHSP